MIKSNPSSLLTSMGDDFVPTRADMESPATWKRLGDSQANERWQALLDHLIEWGSNAACLADDGIDPPSRDTVQWAAQVILALRDSGLRCPDSIVPDPNGGIVIEYGDGDGDDVAVSAEERLP